MAAECIFCKIIAGQIPSLKVHEDADCLAFLDIGPLADGHTLLVPKQHFSRIVDVPAAIVSSMALQLPRLAAAILRTTGAEGLNVLQNNGTAAGQVVEHVHIHLIPRRGGDGLGFRWNAGKYPPGRGEELSRTIAAALS